MAGEFTKRTVDDKNIWTCVLCNADIVSQAKPRSHVCQNNTTPRREVPRSGSQSVPNSPFVQQPFHGYQGNFPPPPGFNVHPPNAQGRTDLSAIFQFQMLQQNRRNR